MREKEHGVSATPMISIIVPVYNAEKYLHRCIDSILSQTFADFELLLIDDGSKDKSGAICDEYAVKDNRVRVFHKENGGVSSARNLGLDNACGEWVTFVDSDDEICSLGRITDESDMVIASLDIQRSDGRKEVISFSHDVISGDELKYFLEKHIQSHIFSSAYAKYIKRKLIGGLRFDTSMKMGEDTVFILKCINQVNTMSFDKNYIYKYYLMSTYDKKYQQSITDSIYCLNEIFGEYSLLGIRNLMFERNVFLCYKSLCQQEIYRNPSAWYNNPRVMSVYHMLSKEIGMKYRVKYRLMSIPVFLKIVNYMRRRKNLY